LNPNSIDIKIYRLDNGLSFDANLVFDQSIKDNICLWMNRGLVIEDLKTNANSRIDQSIAKDPDLGLIDLRRAFIAVEHPVRELYIKYHGSLEPTLFPSWGCRRDTCIGRAEVFWYPYTLSCGSVFWDLLQCSHREASIEIFGNGFTPIASIPVVEKDGDHVLFRGSDVYQPLEFIIGSFEKQYCGEDFDLYMYYHGVQLYSCGELYDYLDKIFSAYRELFNVDNPHKQHHIVFLENTGGFHTYSLTVLDRKYVDIYKGLLLNLIHEMSHIWWAGKIKLCSVDSTWLMESIPEYVTSRIAGYMGLIDLDEHVREMIMETNSYLSSKKYVPPTGIIMPMDDFSNKIWRVVGETLFLEIGMIVGYNNLDQLFSKYMKRSMEKEGIMCLTWSMLRDELVNLDAQVAGVLERYRLM